MNNNDIVRNASVIMNHYERALEAHRTAGRGGGEKLDAHCKEKKIYFTIKYTLTTHRKEDDAWSSRTDSK